jgi:alkanesulfonate monooxygenase SsuD/methylene tetrahydromethanopterin reductase-like flavin-dependent oxidoreductase (luciferase family)
MRFGLVTTNQHWLEDQLATLDVSGFASLYVVDHPAFPIPDPWTWLAFAAARTERIRLGTHVTGAPFHHPASLAKQVATVDRLSRGRAVLGIGTAYEKGDFAPYGFEMRPFPERLAALAETLRIVKSLWTEAKTEFSGQHFRLQGGAVFEPKPVQQPHPPIVIGLNRHGEALSLAAEYADAINTWQLGADQVAALVPHLRAACEALGRDPSTLALTADVLLARGADRAAADGIARNLSAAARSWGRSRSVTEWSADGVLHGDAGAICDQVKRFEDVGVSELGVAIHSVDDLEWFGDRVIAG